jgi:hypothetical protein
VCRSLRIATWLAERCWELEKLPEGGNESVYERTKEGIKSVLLEKGRVLNNELVFSKDLEFV